jgi:hypothetical protein
MPNIPCIPVANHTKSRAGRDRWEASGRPLVGGGDESAWEVVGGRAVLLILGLARFGTALGDGA